MNLDRLEWHLDNWILHHRRGDRGIIAKHGYPSKSLMMMGGGAVGEDDTEIAGEAADANAANSIDSIIYSLKNTHIIAIECKYGVNKTRKLTHEKDLLEAKEAIIKIADRRGLF